MSAVVRGAVYLTLPALLAGCALSRAPSGPSCELVGRTLAEVSRDPKPEGLSDITRIGGNLYWSVDDRGGLLHELEIALDRKGGIQTCRTVRSVKLAGRRDLEGCARDPLDGRIWVSDEGDTSVRQFDPVTGEETARAEIPDVFARNAVGNRSFEALAISPDGKTMYVANEDTLACDGAVSGRTAGGVVRILALVRSGKDDPWKPVRQFRYRTESIGGAPYRGLEISGVVALAVSRSGTLYVLERELSQKNPLFPTFRASLYAVCPKDAKEDGLDKRLVWSEDTMFANYEGLCLGPVLEDGTPTMVLVSDGGGPAVETVRVLALRARDDVL